jgi:hypothetical protein
MKMKDGLSEKEIEPKYFCTPGTSFQEKIQISNFNDFDIDSMPYRRLTTRIITKRYALNSIHGAPTGNREVRR